MATITLTSDDIRFLRAMRIRPDLSLPSASHASARNQAIVRWAAEQQPPAPSAPLVDADPCQDAKRWKAAFWVAAIGGLVVMMAGEVLRGIGG